MTSEIPTPAPKKPKLPPTKASLGAAIRSLRKTREWTQSKLAEKAGISVKTLNGIEYGRCWPSVPVYASLVKALRGGQPPFLT